jgi:hypothetical protein
MLSLLQLHKIPFSHNFQGSLQAFQVTVAVTESTLSLNFNLADNPLL